MDTPDILFQYLKDIVYNTENASLDVEKLPSDFQRVGMALQLVGTWVREAKEMSSAITRGDFSYSKVDKENVFASPLKEQQAMLRHLTWQTQQIAKGDYSQNVDFMGDFSEAFNSMTRQLGEHREKLLAEKKQIEEKNAEIESMLELVTAFADRTHNMIVIHALDGRGKLFENARAAEFQRLRPNAGSIVAEKLKQKDEEAIETTKVWEFALDEGKDGEKVIYFQVESYPILWRNQKALVHIVWDDTERKRKENLIRRFAYVDALTNLYNKRYAMEKMRTWVAQQEPFVLSYVDVDYLKYCNDTQGHDVGDVYLLDIARALGDVGGVLCRTGGDEFIIIQTGVTAAGQDKLLEEIRRKVQEDALTKTYPQSFSYASCEIPSHPQKTLAEYMALADSRMYEYKMKHKKPLKDMMYKDNRTI